MTNERLNKIYDKTHGCCHLCHKKLAFSNYGTYGAKGAWHIEHSTPRAKGGTDHLNNLFPACISCNLEKGTYHTKTVRKTNGVTRAPYSKAKKDQLRQSNMMGMGVVGTLVGAGLGGPVGAFLGAIIGAEIGRNASPKR